MHPELPPSSLPQQLAVVRAQLEASIADCQDRSERALLAHACSHLAELERCSTALSFGSHTSASSAASTPAVDGEGGTLLGDAEWDLVHDAVDWSAEMYRIFARAPQEGPLTLDQLPGALHPEDRRAVSGLLTAALVDGKPIDAEFRLQLGDGTVRSVHCVGAPQLAADGYVEAVWLALRDLGRTAA
ncbi:PAS domain-containing protein [Streptacidiphilus fuscans]|uniref:PAS domain-containing protein n=1 Tax=Streptacidiphilus fuscans TaxID=2789292 RepID=A0A931BAL9_9ACTN|nr:PAS domain-containing protein [Streptacidiphilus fuscans]MBF9069930.1 PAS domain-containing protein [Streptacidiphilus fuscans]